MALFAEYLKRYSVFLPEFSHEVDLIITIPVYDEPEICDTLDSLFSSTVPAGKRVGVILVVNHAVNSPDSVKNSNVRIVATLQEYVRSRRGGVIEVYLKEAFDLPVKEAGVGAARKMAMDAAVAYFSSTDNKDGVIVTLDGDTLVENNYLTEIWRTFKVKNISGVSINYAHRLEGITEEQRASIIKYELYLRYYRHALDYIGHPYAYYSIGSAIAVRVRDYIAIGGMNKREAGEDFYFVQKLIAGGRFANLATTKVYPASRVSERTPFGTGRAINSIMESGGEWDTYNFAAFKALKCLFDMAPKLFKKGDEIVAEAVAIQPEAVRSFLVDMGFKKIIKEINSNTSSEYQFCKRFFDNFNAFRVLKYLNFVHPLFFLKQPILEAVQSYAETLGIGSFENEWESLKYFRVRDDENKNIF